MISVMLIMIKRLVKVIYIQTIILQIMKIVVMKHVRVILEMIMLNVVYLKDMMHLVQRLNIVHSYVIIMIQIHQWNSMYVKMTLDVMLSIVQ